MSELAGLYSRYKALALAVGAGLIVDADVDADGESGRLGAETLRLAADAGRHREIDASPAARAAHHASLDLHRLATAIPGAPGHAALIEQVRASHKALRSHLWDDIAHQYTPCGAHPHRHTPGGAHPHRHTQEHDHV